MRFGLTTPILTLVPRTHAEWERNGGTADLRAIALAADRLGYAHVSCSEHVAIPTDVARARGGRYYDPAATLGFVSAITSRIRLLTHVLVMPYHHPLSVAKRYGTLDRLSSGRVILGVGVGSLRSEFDLLGVDFDDRGPRYEDALRALRASLSTERPEYHGSHYDFADLIVDPCAVQQHVPIWIGGRSPRSLRRALALADGWDPFGLGVTQLDEMLRRARDWPQWRDRAAPFEVVLSPERPLSFDDTAQMESSRAVVAEYHRIGATSLNLRFRHRSSSHYIEILERFALEVMPEFDPPQ